MERGCGRPQLLFGPLGKEKRNLEAAETEEGVEDSQSCLHPQGQASEA